MVIIRRGCEGIAKCLGYGQDRSIKSRGFEGGSQMGGIVGGGPSRAVPRGTSVI